MKASADLPSSCSERRWRVRSWRNAMAWSLSGLLWGCHLGASTQPNSNAATATTTSAGGSTWSESGFRLADGAEMTTGEVVTIVGDFSGVAPSQVWVTFSGATQRVVPELVTTTQLRVVVPPSASSGALQLFAEGDMLWSIGVDVQRGSQPKLAPGEACAVDSEVAAVGSRVDIRGSFTGLQRRDVQVRFAGSGRRTRRAVLVTDSRVTAKVPKKATSGEIEVLHEGKKLCQTKLRVVPAPAPTRCSVNPSTAATNASIDVTGAFVGVRKEDITLRFKGRGTPVEAAAANEDQVSAVIPDGAKSGRVSVLYGGRELCNVRIEISKRHTGAPTSQAGGAMKSKH